MQNSPVSWSFITDAVRPAALDAFDRQGWSVGRLVGWLVYYLVKNMVGWLVASWLLRWMVGWLVGWSVFQHMVSALPGMMPFRVAISTAPGPQGTGRVDILTHPHTTIACAAGVVTRTTDRDRSRYRDSGNQRTRQQTSWIAKAIELNRHTTCMKIRGSVVSLSFVFPHLPEDIYIHNKKKLVRWLVGRWVIYTWYIHVLIWLVGGLLMVGWISRVVG